MAKPPSDSKSPNTTSRRNFIKTGSSLLVAGGAVAASGLNVANAAHAYGSDAIKIGLVGCGGRGTGAAIQALNTEGEVHLMAMGDAFSDRLQGSLRAIKGKHGDKVKVTPETQFVGFDAYKKVLDADIDLVILATPPGFRPLHFEAAVNADKMVFAEKPVATDPAGVQRFLNAAKVAKEKGLAVQVGLQRRHEQAYKETIAQLQEGAIGDILLSRAYWNGGGVWVRPRQEGQTELEYQMRNWYYFNWLCGDHITEQHIHNLDVINWLKDSYPVSANGMGGREVRDDIEYGQIFDHHFVEFTFADGSKCYSQCRHIKGCWNSVSEHAHGTNGSVDIGGGKIYDAKGKMTWSTKGKRGGHQEEHHDLFREIRAGNTPFEAEYGAKSTMTSILGRMATYSGKIVTWDEALNSGKSLADVDAMTSMKDKAPVQPNDKGLYDIPVPGKTKVL
ncbi:MAG: Gfo/Idh/MocA family oxidoreductase [bacterium]|nr:Gfo/Idh/MocA family oxidoreductase [bacterium]